MSPKLILQYPVPILLEVCSLLLFFRKGREGLLWFRRDPCCHSPLIGSLEMLILVKSKRMEKIQSF